MTKTTYPLLLELELRVHDQQSIMQTSLVPPPKHRRYIHHETHIIWMFNYSELIMYSWIPLHVLSLSMFLDTSSPVPWGVSISYQPIFKASNLLQAFHDMQDNKLSIKQFWHLFNIKMLIIIYFPFYITPTYKAISMNATSTYNKSPVRCKLRVQQ